MFAGRVESLIRVPTGGAAAAATNSVGGPSTCTVPAADYYYTAAGGVSSLITVLQAQLNASRPSGWTVTLSTGVNGTGKVTIHCTNTPWSLTWTSTVLRDLLGHTGNYAGVSVAQTGTLQARGLWFPDCPLRVKGHPRMAPKVSDLVTMVSPTGNRMGLVSSFKRRHRDLVWSHVPEARYRELAAATTNASWEKFVDDTQHGQGLAWFDVQSKCQIYWDDAGTERPLGIDFNAGAGVSGWYFDVGSVDEAEQASPGWTGLWKIQLPELTTKE